MEYRDQLSEDYQSASPEQRYEIISSQHGGFQRYDFIDHAFLINRYFPPERFFNHLKEHIHELVLNYPVAQNELARLMSTWIQQPQEQIVVGNGLSEFIKIISGRLGRRQIVVVPSFNEYENAAPARDLVRFPLETPDFTLDVDTFVAQAKASGSQLAIIVSPNNPTSIAVPRAVLIQLTEKLGKLDCMLIIDESFVDFAQDFPAASLENVVELYENLVILKSLGKTCGIGGLRLGYMLTNNREFHRIVRDEVHIWNVNSLAETFLQLAPDYRQEFQESCRKVCDDRNNLYELLKDIPELKVYRPDANYVFCRLPHWAPDGSSLCRSLFIEQNLLMKNCKNKTIPEADRYLRIASRSKADNQFLSAALNKLLHSNRTGELI